MNFEEAADALADVDDSALSKVSKLIRQAEFLERAVSDAEATVKVLKEQQRDILEVAIPATLAEFGLREVRMDNGSIVSVSSYYAASIPADRREEAYNWLRDHGHGDLVKTQVSISFGRQEDERALELARSLQLRGYTPSHDSKVEPMTLKAFVREQIEKGAELPTDLFGVYTGQKAKIMMKKGPR